MREVIAVWIRLQRKTFARPACARDILLAAFGRVTNALQHGQLLQACEDFRAGDHADDLIDIHRTCLADHCLHAGVVGGDLDNLPAAEAAAPYPQAIGVDFGLEGEPRERVAVILHLIVRRYALAWFAAAGGTDPGAAHQRSDGTVR